MWQVSSEYEPRTVARCIADLGLCRTCHLPFHSPDASVGYTAFTGTAPDSVLVLACKRATAVPADEALWLEACHWVDTHGRSLVYDLLTADAVKPTPNGGSHVGRRRIYEWIDEISSAPAHPT